MCRQLGNAHLRKRRRADSSGHYISRSRGQAHAKYKADKHGQHQSNQQPAARKRHDKTCKFQSGAGKTEHARYNAGAGTGNDYAHRTKRAFLQSMYNVHWMGYHVLIIFIEHRTQNHGGNAYKSCTDYAGICDGQAVYKRKYWYEMRPFLHYHPLNAWHFFAWQSFKARAYRLKIHHQEYCDIVQYRRYYSRAHDPGIRHAYR